jgi:hypothetical protein
MVLLNFFNLTNISGANTLYLLKIYKHIFMNIKLFIAIVSLICITFYNSVAQINYSAYTDLQNRFYLFDNGSTTQIEGLQPISYKIGRTGLAYLNNMSVLKVYRDGNNNKVNDNITTDYGVTDNYIYYKGGNSLSIIDGNEDKTLSRWVGEYAVGDSVVMFYDKVRNVLNAYYDNKTWELENNLANTTFSNYAVSDNVIAYVNYADQFKVFYQGANKILEIQPVTNIQVGRNVVAYTDVNGQFKVFYNGDVTTLEGFAPISFKVGDNVIAYQAYDGNFKIWYQGETKTIGYFDANYKVQDFVVLYQDGNGFSNIFHKGKTINVDNFYPTASVMGYNSFAYINKANVLRVFQNGEFYDVSTLVNNLDNVQLDYDVLRYKIGLNMYRFFSDGKDY